MLTISTKTREIIRLVILSVLAPYTIVIIAVVLSLYLHPQQEKSTELKALPDSVEKITLQLPVSIDLEMEHRSSTKVGELSIPRQQITTWEVDTMNLIEILEYEEGFRSEPYLCSEDYVTIGLGTKLHNDQGLNPKDFLIHITRATAEEWLNEDVAKIDVAMKRSRVATTYNELDEDRRAIIISMAYQMGITGVLNFRNMWRALQSGNYTIAAAEALDSRWAKQTPKRAERHARVLAGETVHSVYGS